MYCMQCASFKHLPLLKLATNQWFERAYGFMNAMNPDNMTMNTSTLGDERPSIQGPYFFPQNKQVWNIDTFMTMIGNVNKDLWPTLCQGDTYQTIIGNDVNDRYGTVVFLFLLFMNCNL